MISKFRSVIQIVEQNFRAGMAVAGSVMVVKIDAVIVTEDIEFMAHAGENQPASLYGTNVSDIGLPLNSVIKQAFFQYAQIKYCVMRDQQSD